MAEARRGSCVGVRVYRRAILTPNREIPAFGVQNGLLRTPTWARTSERSDAGRSRIAGAAGDCIRAKRGAVRRAVERQRDFDRNRSSGAARWRREPESAFPLKGGCREATGGWRAREAAGRPGATKKALQHCCKAFLVLP